MVISIVYDYVYINIKGGYETTNFIDSYNPSYMVLAKVVKVEDFGCFVELWDGCEGLVHVSQLAHERVNSPKDVVKVGDEIVVKALGYDNRGRLNLSRKDALPKDESKKEKKSK